MNIYLNSMLEYVAACVGMCGEVDKETLIGAAPAPRNSVQKAIGSLSKQKVVKEHKYDDGRKFLRLSSVNGGSFLQDISPALFMQACAVVNKELKYGGSKKARLRERTNYELYHSLLNQGIPINGITIEKRNNILGASANESRSIGKSIFDATETDLQKAAAMHIDEDRMHFFTKKAIKRMTVAGEKYKGSGQGARHSGVFVLGAQIYFAYALDTVSGSAWNAESEVSSANAFCGCVETLSPYFTENRLRADPSCIICYASPEEAILHITANINEDITVRIDPTRIYKRSLIQPSLSPDENLMALIRMDDWEDKIVKALFPGAVKSEAADGMLPDGTEIRNFIACDLNKIRRADTRIREINNHVIILAPEWATDALRELFPRNGIDFVGFSPADMAIITAAIAEK